jgi:PTS system N-acetylgalactosamine-specific IID component
MESKEQKLTKNDYFIATMRSYFLQNGFNYNTYQGTGYANIIFPGLKKIYKDDQEALKKATIDNLEFYNVNPQTVPFVTSLQLAMLDHGEDVSKIRSIKMALMGPLAGIGDAISQFGVAQLFSTIFASMAIAGITASPIMFLVCMIGFNLFLKCLLGWLGYRMGTSAIEMLSQKINQISRAANIVGVTVISGLAVSFVKAEMAIEYATTIDGEQQVVALQTVFDQILPRLLPGLVTIMVYYLIKKKNWNVYKLLILLFVLGILGSLSGILG